MNLSTFKSHFSDISNIQFKLPNDMFIPSHFHITECGYNDKLFIDCGGAIRKMETISFHISLAQDYHHRLTPEKLSQIINVAESKLDIINNEINVEIEYQEDNTLGRYDISFENDYSLLKNKAATCLASKQTSCC